MKADIDGKIAAVRSALQGTDVDAIRHATDTLNTAMQQLGQTVYSQQSTPPPPEGGETQPEGQGGDEGTVEGEFREV
jgi:molecular chaperone DnaK